MLPAMSTPPDLRGRVCLVTGATQGIGKETALALARMGAEVLIVARDRARGQATADALRAASPTGAGDVLLSDLSSQASIRALAAEVRERCPRLHVLVNNAGGINMKRRLTVDELETTFATNHLGYFLLTELLRDLLVASAPARVVNVASRAHLRGAIDFDDLQGERRYDPWAAYCQSKLANVLHAAELARRLAGTGVTANALHPGVIASGFGRGERSLLSIAVRLGAPFLSSPKKGARTSIYLASSPEVEGVTGRYFARCAETTPSRRARDADTARRLWDVSAELTGLPANG
jgi:NAD(P)-dependent dehydrogenase (short-subunit alcohol dehydrogenase family)